MSSKMFAAVLAVGTVGAAMAATSGAAEAHRRHHNHHHRGYVAAGVVGGVAVGTVIAGGRYHGGGPYYFEYGHRPSVVYVPAYSSGSLPAYWSADGCRTSYYAIPSTSDGYGCCSTRRGCGRW